MDSASLLEFDTTAAATGQALWPATVTLGGVAVAAAVVAPRQAATLGPFAEELEPVILMVRILKSVLPEAPAANTILTYNSARWKIRSVTGPAHEAQWTLACEPAP